MTERQTPIPVGLAFGWIGGQALGIAALVVLAWGQGWRGIAGLALFLAGWMMTRTARGPLEAAIRRQKLEALGRMQGRGEAAG